MTTYFEKCASRVQAYRDKLQARVAAYKDKYNPRVATEKYKARNLVCAVCGEHGHQRCTRTKAHC